MTYLQVHRFHEFVAVYIGRGKTVYMTPEEAQTLATALNACAHNTMSTPFGKDSIPTWSLEIEERSEQRPDNTPALPESPERADADQGTTRRRSSENVSES